MALGSGLRWMANWMMMATWIGVVGRWRISSVGHVSSSGDWTRINRKLPFSTKAFRSKQVIRQAANRSRAPGLSLPIRTDSSHWLYVLTQLSSFYWIEPLPGHLWCFNQTHFQSKMAQSPFTLNDDFSIPSITQHIAKVFWPLFPITASTVRLEQREFENNALTFTVSTLTLLLFIARNVG